MWGRKMISTCRGCRSVLSVCCRVREEKQQLMLNLEVQLLMRQGQVEVEAGDFIHSFTDSILIHRGVVEDLNRKIQTLGDQKIKSMNESKDFRSVTSHCYVIVSHCYVIISHYYVIISHCYVIISH